METLLISLGLIATSLLVYFFLYRRFDKKRQERFKTTIPTPPSPAPIPTPGESKTYYILTPCPVREFREGVRYITASPILQSGRRVKGEDGKFYVNSGRTIQDLHLPDSFIDIGPVEEVGLEMGCP